MKNSELLQLFDAIPAQIAAAARQNGDGNARLMAATARLSAANARLAELRPQHSRAKAALESLASQVDKLKKHHRRPEQRAIDAVADLGVAPVATAGAAPTREALLAKLARECDPAKRTKIARQLRELRESSN